MDGYLKVDFKDGEFVTNSTHDKEWIMLRLDDWMESENSSDEFIRKWGQENVSDLAKVMYQLLK